MRRFAALAVGCALIAPLALPLGARAAPYTVDRLLAVEQLVSAKLDPSHRWLVVQRTARWDRAPRYDLDFNTKLGLGRIQVFDVAQGGVERRLDLPEGPGYTALGVSPGGRRLAVARLTGHDYELGVVDLESGQARWLGLSPRQEVWGPSVVWRSDDELLVAARPSGFPDPIMGFGFFGHQRLIQQWDATAHGDLGASVLGSGPSRGLRPQAPVVGLVQVKLKTGEQRILTPGNVRDLSLSPDGRTAAAIVEGEDIQYPLAEPTTPASEASVKRLVMVDLDSARATTPCPDCDLMARFLAWSDDGRDLLVFARQGEVGFSRGRFWRMPSTGPGAPLNLGDLAPALGETYDTAGLPLGGWLDGAPVVYARPAAGGRADYWRLDGDRRTNLTTRLPAESRAIGADADVWAVAAAGQVWRVTARSAQSWGLTQASVRAFGPAPAGFRGDQNFVPALKDLALADPAARPALPWPGTRLPAPLADVRVTDVAPKVRVEVAQDRHGVETVRLIPPADGPKALVTVNAALADVDFAAPVAIRHKGLDGKALTSWLYLPPGLPTGARPPVVVLPYPGAASASPPRAQGPGVFSPTVNAQILAARGYAAIVPAMPYLSGREPIEGLADQMLAPVDAAAALGLVDPDRVAIWGHSYGGYGVIAAATQSVRFKAVIATAPTVNLASAYGRLGPVVYAVPEDGLTVFASTGWQESGQARMGAPPWKDPQLYLRNSPITFVDRITAPVAIFHGDNDKGLDQSAALFGALYRQNKDAIFVTYRGEGHVFYSPGNIRDYLQRVLELLDRTVGESSGGPGLARAVAGSGG
ncbi:prolyl oligopeptidase family serine peptidase [Caulobacter sp. FWC2]|uniref:prolyl oligopeptidase family serine peptidase n=1 Tax=Caulobacter sp. FWC2 TaxID=69664 RepID=UPI000C15B7CF|nr:prolyl oligopeptidase family serine peptidase [Caulobacter sp. FWC2]PIB92754.1 S9 family peptidase [Caulobacter sp. FWC2]